LRLAEVELTADVRSSFFFLTTSDTYNVASARNRAMLRELCASGFEIGLHFDPTLYDMENPDTLQRAVQHEALVLGDAAGYPVTSVSLHNPSGHGRYPLFDGFLNAYDPRIFGPDKYLSDSRMCFARDVWDFLKAGETGVIQLLLHPLHYQERDAQYPAPMVEYIERLTSVVHEIFWVNSEYRSRCPAGLRSALAEEMVRSPSIGSL
jgi:hypothetical protein